MNDCLPHTHTYLQDEVTFVLGQPNFMEQGSCCGVWGLSEGEESCPQTASCRDCYDPEDFGCVVSGLFVEQTKPSGPSIDDDCFAHPSYGGCACGCGSALAETYSANTCQF